MPTSAATADHRVSKVGTPARGRAAGTASPVAIWTAILILYVVWGSTYLAIRFAVGSIPPFVMAGGRFAISGLVLLGAVAVIRRGRVPFPSRIQWRDAFIVGTCLMLGGMGLVSWAEQTVPSGIAGVLIAMMPVWIAVIGRVFLGERLPRIAGVGILIGIVGVALLVAQGVAFDRSLDPLGIFALVVSPIAWASGSVYAAHRAQLPEDPFVTTGLEMLCGSVALGVAAVASGELAAFRAADVTAQSLAGVLYLTVVGSLVAFTAFAWVIRQAPLPLVTTYAFVNPIIAVFLGWLIVGESVNPVQLVAGGVIVAGVALIIVARSRMPNAARSDELIADAGPTPADEPVAA
jgi:drug/metabolite transporter (DMT)-like permease